MVSSSFSSLYIGILAATCRGRCCIRCDSWVSVPFTSGSSLQHKMCRIIDTVSQFQFPLHRDPRCNQDTLSKMTAATGFSSLYIGILAATDAILFEVKEEYLFQFPLHRDPRCNLDRRAVGTSPSSFQFPLHRDPRCNIRDIALMADIMLFQFPLHRDPRCNLAYAAAISSSLRFSSLYIGILAATHISACLRRL